MGNANAKEIEKQQLIVRNRLLERQATQHLQVDPAVRNAINDVKKNHKYTNLVLPGGAVKGVALVGALGYLHDHRYLTNITNIACTSAGSIFGTLYAIGYSVPELKKIVQDLDLAKLAGVNKPLVSDIFHIATEYGANNGQHLVDTIGDLIEKRTGKKNYTLEELWKEKGINLCITSTDITTGETIYFWHGRYPKMPIRVLIRMSTSMPGLFAPVIFDGHYLIDGGLLDNCPIHVFDGKTPDDPYAKLNMTKVDPCTLAFLLIPDLPVSDCDPILKGDITAGIPQKPVNNIRGMEDYLGAMVNTVVDSGVERYQKPSYWLRTVPIHVPNYPSYHFGLTHNQKMDLLSCGHSDTAEFFKV